MLRTRKLETPPLKTVEHEVPPVPSQGCRSMAEDERADLPALERVTEQAWAGIAMYAFMGLVPAALLAGLVVGFGAGLRELLNAGTSPSILPALSIGGLGVVALLAWLFRRVGRGDFAWSTDPEGIEARGLFHHRRLRWAEITATICTELGYYYLEGPGGRISFTSSRLAASAWQHLRRHDRHRSFAVGADVQSYWADYPVAELPLYWTNPARRAPRHVDGTGSVVLASVWFTFVVILCLSMNGWGGIETILTLAGLGAVAHVWCRAGETARNCVRRCEVTAEGLRGETWGDPFDLRWTEIVEVSWQQLGEHAPALRVRGGSPARDLFLLVNRTDRKLEPVIYALLRRLRHADPPQALPLPLWLRDTGTPPERTG